LNHGSYLLLLPNDVLCVMCETGEEVIPGLSSHPIMLAVVSG